MSDQQQSRTHSDVPPDVAAGTAVPLPAVTYGRGGRDELYPADVHARDVATLARLGVPVESVMVEGGHEWTPEFAAAASRAIATARGGR